MKTIDLTRLRALSAPLKTIQESYRTLEEAFVARVGT